MARRLLDVEFLFQNFIQDPSKAAACSAVQLAYQPDRGTSWQIRAYLRLIEVDVESGRIYLLVYVDDFLIVARSKADMEWVKQALTSKFKARDLGEAHYFLTIDVARDRAGRINKLISSSQRRFTADLVK